MNFNNLIKKSLVILLASLSLSACSKECPVGPQGIQGEKGEPGLNGQDGHSPVITIGENGNWFINGIDTNVKAQGQQGNPGTPGNDGEDGTNGTDGKDGASFLQGTGDPTSEVGANGDTYLNTTTYDLFYKSNNIWSKVGNIQAPVVQEEYTVTFESNGGTEIEPQKVLSGHKIIVPEDPVKEDYIFTGWTLEDGTYLGTHDKPQNFNFFIPTNDITLYATYEYSNRGKFVVQKIITTIQEQIYDTCDLNYRSLGSLIYDSNSNELITVVLSEPEGAPIPGGGQGVTILKWGINSSVSSKEEMLEKLLDDSSYLILSSVETMNYLGNRFNEYDVLKNHIGENSAIGYIYGAGADPVVLMYSGIMETTSSTGEKGYISEIYYLMNKDGTSENTNTLIQTITSENDESSIWFQALRYIFNEF